MRDPKRIDRILGLLSQYWKECPDLRLGQIISIMTPDRFRRDVCDFDGTPHGYVRDSFNVEDDEMEKAIREALDGNF